MGTFKDTHYFAQLNYIQISRDHPLKATTSCHLSRRDQWSRTREVFQSKPCLFRGTVRPFSVKYLFGEANIAWDFLLLEDGWKFLDDRSTLGNICLAEQIFHGKQSWVHLNTDLTGKLLVFWTGSRFSICGRTIFQAYLINSPRFSEV